MLLHIVLVDIIGRGKLIKQKVTANGAKFHIYREMEGLQRIYDRTAYTRTRKYIIKKYPHYKLYFISNELLFNSHNCTNTLMSSALGVNNKNINYCDIRKSLRDPKPQARKCICIFFHFYRHRLSFIIIVIPFLSCISLSFSPIFLSFQKNYMLRCLAKYQARNFKFQMETQQWLRQHNFNSDSMSFGFYLRK